jgi:hypothetical protein
MLSYLHLFNLVSYTNLKSMVERRVNESPAMSLLIIRETEKILWVPRARLSADKQLKCNLPYMEMSGHPAWGLPRLPLLGPSGSKVGSQITPEDLCHALRRQCTDSQTVSGTPLPCERRNDEIIYPHIELDLTELKERAKEVNLKTLP